MMRGLEIIFFPWARCLVSSDWGEQSSSGQGKCECVCVCGWVETDSAVRLWCTGRRPTSALCTLMTPTATGQLITSGQIIFYASNLNSVYRLFTLLGFLILKWNIILRPGQQSFFVRVTEVKTLTCAAHCLQLQSDDTTYFL